MESVLCDIRKNLLFWKRYSVSLLEFRGWEYLCVRTFTEGLKNNFDVEIAGLIWPIESGGWTTRFAIPNQDKFKIWLEKDEIQNKLKVIDRTNRRWMRYQEEDSVRKEKGVCSFSKEFIALRVPRIYEKHFGKRSCYICLVNPSICTPQTEGIQDFELDCLSNLVDVWVWGVDYHRDVLSKACSLLRKGNIESSDRKTVEDTIKKCLDCIYRMMSIREVLQLVDIKKVEGEEKDKVSDTLLNHFWELAENEEKEWHHCAPPLWPPCLGAKHFAGSFKLLEILQSWTKCSDPKILHEHRLEGNFGYQQYLNDLRFINKKSMLKLAIANEENSRDLITLYRNYLFNFFFNLGVCPSNLF